MYTIIPIGLLIDVAPGNKPGVKIITNTTITELKNIVITMGFEIFVSRNDLPGAKAGQAYKRRFTNIWMKKKGKWQQIARHASIICQ